MFLSGLSSEDFELAIHDRPASPNLYSIGEVNTEARSRLRTRLVVGSRLSGDADFVLVLVAAGIRSGFRSGAAIVDCHLLSGYLVGRPYAFENKGVLMRIEKVRCDMAIVDGDSMTWRKAPTSLKSSSLMHALRPTVYPSSWLSWSCGIFLSGAEHRDVAPKLIRAYLGHHLGFNEDLASLQG